jgi:hypothetical protein
MFENLLLSFIVDIFVLRFQYFWSVPRSKSALPKRKFNLKTFKGVSIIRRGANIPLPHRISKVIIIKNLLSSFFVDIFVLRFQDFHSVPRSKSALPKRKFNFKTLKGVSIIRREANIPLPYRISKVIHVWKSTFIIYCWHFRVTISILSECATVKIRVWKSTFIIYCWHFRVTISILSECATVKIRVTQTKIQL